MKKFIFSMFAALMMAVSMFAQTAVETPKVFDNTYISVGAGVATPLAFDAVFPLNATSTLAVGKEFTPVWGAEVEGTAWFGSHAFGGSQMRFDSYPSHNVVRGTYVGVNGTTNLSNLFWGYKGTPRTFEVSTVLGGGWIHTFTPNAPDETHNGFGVKTGLDFAFNLGKSKAHTINIRPSVLWNVTGGVKMPMEFDKRYAQAHLAVAYTYHFRTSNGTHAFKVHNVGALYSEIDRLNGVINALKNRPVESNVTVVKETVEVEKVVPTNSVYTVCFAFDSAELSTDAKTILDAIPTNVAVDIDAYASPEGAVMHNHTLSVNRAKAVADYLETRGVKVNDATGHGVSGETSNRLAIVTIR